MTGACFFLGVGAHALQDLVYHRGMTLSQHSILTYTLDRNPDFPPGRLRKQRYEEAKALTEWLVKRVRERLKTHEWDNLRNWRSPGGFDYPKLAEEIYRGKEDIGFWELIRYWWHSQVDSETFNEKRFFNEKLVRWNLGSVKAALEEALAATDS